MKRPPPGEWERREPDNIIVTDSQCRAISSQDPRIPLGAHFGPFLGPKNSRLINSVLPHIARSKPVFLNMSSYRIDKNTEVPAAELHIIKNSYGGYIFMFWRKAIIRPRTNPMQLPDREVVSSSQNSFIVSESGYILAVAFPDRAVGNVIGVNIYDTIWPEYIRAVKCAVKKVLETHEPVDIEYKFSLYDETRHKVGYISPAGGKNIVFNVRRITQQELKLKTG